MNENEPPIISPEKKFKLEFKKNEELITGLMYFLRIKNISNNKIDDLEEQSDEMNLIFMDQPIDDKEDFLKRQNKILEDLKDEAIKLGVNEKAVSNGNIRFYYLTFLEESDAHDRGKKITGH